MQQAILLHVIRIPSEEDCSPFLDYLPYPEWWKTHFKPVFDKYRLESDGMILLAYDGEKERVVGTIFVDSTPLHLSFGKKVPLFGWLFADSEEICHRLLREAENYTTEIFPDCEKIRGPINNPNLFGGWGIPVKDDQLPMMVDSPQIPAHTAEWLQNAGYEVATTYASTEIIEIADHPNPFKPGEIEYLTPKVADLLADTEFLQELATFADQNFGYLPDHTEGKFYSTLQMIKDIPDAEKYYLIIKHKITGEIIAAAQEIPNLFEYWQSKPITCTDINALVVAKKYRNLMLSHLTMDYVTKNLRSTDVKREIGVMVWKRNLPAMKSFLKSCKIVAEFNVFEKSF